MLLDKQSLYSEAQAITATARSTNIIDHGAAGTPKHAKKAIHRDQGKASHVPLMLLIGTAFNNLTSLTVALQVDDDVAFGSPKTVWSMVVPQASLTAGAVIPLESFPVGMDERYSSLLYTVTGTAPTTGSITAGVVEAREEAWPRT